MIDDDVIREELRRIEDIRGVRVLFAVESGSRAWGFHSPDSDFDVRFIYQDSLRNIVSVFEGNQVIQETFFLEGTPIDMVGWSLKKALALGTASNPQFCEWVMRAPSYLEQDGFREDMQAIAALSSPRVLAHHYRGLAQRTISAYLEKDEDPIAKKYLYAIRSTLSSEYMVRHPNQGVTPPIIFDHLMNEIEISPEIRVTVRDLLSFKMSQGETSARRRFPDIDIWLNEMQDVLREKIQEISDTYIPQEIPEEIYWRYTSRDIEDNLIKSFETPNMDPTCR